MMAHTARQRYADIFRDVEKLIDDHSKQLAVGVLEHTLTWLSCSPNLSIPVKTEHVSPEHIDILHSSSAGRSLYPTRCCSYNIFEALCRAFLQRHQTDLEHCSIVVLGETQSQGYG